MSSDIAMHCRLVQAAATLEEEATSEEERKIKSCKNEKESGEEEEEAKENEEPAEKAEQRGGEGIEGEVFLLENLGYRGYREDVLKDR